MTKMNSLLILFNSLFLIFLILSSYFVTYITLMDKTKIDIKSSNTHNLNFEKTDINQNIFKNTCKNSNLNILNNAEYITDNYSFSKFTNHSEFFFDHDFSKIIYYKNNTKEDANEFSYDSDFKNNYLITSIVQTCFAFGLSGLITNKKVLKLGIY